MDGTNTNLGAILPEIPASPNYPDPVLENNIRELGRQLREEDDRRPQRKTWRVYFNRREDFPFLAAVDNGTIASQIRVQHVRMEKVDHAGSVSDMGPNPFRDDTRDPWERTAADLRRARKGKHNEPTWWIQFEAIAFFENGGVMFYGEGAQ